MTETAAISASDLCVIFPPNKIDVLGELERFLRRYVVLPDAAYLPLAVWVLATYLAKVFDCFPYLALLSPAKRCGKTRLLEVLEILCWESWRGTAPTPAALFRMMTRCPTLLLDEVEALKAGKNTSETQQAILAILNAGHRRGATVPRCAGKDQHLEFFPVYGPKAFAAIGKLPDTLADRSIVVTMQRRKAEQRISRFLFGRAKGEVELLVECLAKWSKEHDEDSRAAYESTTDLTWLSDRDADLWMPLFAVCSVAAPGRVSELKENATALTGAKTGDDLDDSLPLRLLSDIRAIWPDGTLHISSATLLELLRAIEDAPWLEYEVTARKLAKWLRPFGASPRQVRVGNVTVKGYQRAEFEEAFTRYLSDTQVQSETTETTRANTGENLLFPSETTRPCFTSENDIKPA
jgi:Protein of unknown function (DUF3631)